MCALMLKYDVDMLLDNKPEAKHPFTREHHLSESFLVERLLIWVYTLIICSARYICDMYISNDYVSFLLVHS